MIEDRAALSFFSIYCYGTRILRLLFFVNEVEKRLRFTILNA